jgi:hemerythrin-like domain-containing protein
MGIQIGAKADAGFDDPIGMLKDCHRRIEHFLNIVCVVVDRAGNRTLTEEETAAIQSALHYFRTGGQRHSADEEQSLFPRMRAADPSAALGEPEWREIGMLEQDHRMAEQDHARVDALYSAWMNEGALRPEQHAELAAATLRLKRLYEHHIDLEERVVFPCAARMLEPDDLAAMGEEFRARRA